MTVIGQLLNVSLPPNCQMNGMFFGATNFNRPANFNTSSVLSVRIFVLSSFIHNHDQSPVLTNFNLTYYQMDNMFAGATTFNQDLCHFGDHWPYESVTNMFVGTDCTNSAQPTSASGPWCAVTTCP